jgi:hypothetical protein
VAALTSSGHRADLAGGRFVRAVNYHNTPRSQREALREELTLYLKRFAPISLAELDHFFRTGEWQTDQPGFLPVFYEGYRTCFDVAAPVCEELGIAGWFMVCTGFVDCPPPEQELFARSHDIGLVGEDLLAPGSRIALSWDEIAEMAARHVLSPHTASHVGIADVNSAEDFEREIVEPKRKLDAATGQSAPAFAWLWGTQWGMSERHDRAVREAGYRYLISNLSIHRIA